MSEPVKAKGRPHSGPTVNPSDGEDEVEEVAGMGGLMQALNGSAMQVPGQMGVGGYSIERCSSPGIVDWLLDAAAARKHREVMAAIRDAGIETMEAQNVASMIALDFVANSLDSERTIEQIIRQYQDSQMVLASAPVYVQLARSMQMQTVPAIAQAGMNRIRRKIEQR